MFIAVNRIKVETGLGARVEQRFGASSGLEDQPGFISFRLLKRSWAHGPVECDEYLSLTEWATRDDFFAWTRSEHFRKAHSGMRTEAIIGAEPAGYDICVECRAAPESD